MMKHILFVYGTLQQPGNEFAAYLNKYYTYLKPAKIKGLLYDVGEYPALIVNSDKPYWINGGLFDIDEKALKLIDSYEGYGDKEEQPNLFKREKHTTSTADGEIDAWVYIYNLPVDGLKLIPSGNYMEYLVKKNPPIEITGGLE
jgi:gamma-glutamylcyclotransferase (GGCT)/AIG2-like uncharacterized protein YtfP